MIEVALIAQVIVWIVMIGMFAASRQATVFHPAVAYLFFHGLVFVLRPILVYVFGFDTNFVYMQFKPPDDAFVRTLAVTSVGMVCFVSATLLFGRSRLVFESQAHPTFTDLERRSLLVITLLLLPAMAYSIYATRNGVSGDRVNGIYIMTNSTGYLNEAQDFIMPLLCVWMVVTRFHWLGLFPSILYVGYRTWFGWSRWTILLFFLLLVMIYCWYHRKKWIPFWSVLVAIPILLLFNLIGHNRDMFKSFLTGEDTHVAEFDVGMTADDKFKSQFDTQDFANFDYLTYLVWAVPEKTGSYTFGAQYVQLFTEPIPRILWRGKPVGSPVKTIDIAAYCNFVGLTFSLVGDGWCSGGWIGLIITLSTVGTILGLAHRSFWRNGQNTMGCILYLVSLAMVPQWYRDGGISIAKFLLFNVTPILMWIGMTWLLGRRLVPGYSVLLPAGTRVRFLQPAPGSRSQPESSGETPSINIPN
jgi:hypothetical protein